jgi:hypothetical protein
MEASPLFLMFDLFDLARENLSHMSAFGLPLPPVCLTTSSSKSQHSVAM